MVCKIKLEKYKYSYGASVFSNAHYVKLSFDEIETVRKRGDKGLLVIDWRELL